MQTFSNKGYFALTMIYLILSTTAASAQVSILANPGTSANIIVGGSNYHALEAIYTTAELGTNFTTAGTAITKIAFNCTTAATANTTVSSFKVYFKDIAAATTTLAAGTYSTMGYTLVYSGSMDVATTGLKLVTLSAPYVRTSGTNLEMLIERTDNLVHTATVFASANGNETGSAVNSSRRYNSTTALSGTTSLGASAFRPAIFFNPTVWTGTGNWSTAANWSDGVPTCTSAAIINSGAVTVDISGAVAQHIAVVNGASLLISSGGSDLTSGCTLNNNSFINSGTVNVSGGTLAINGNMVHNLGSTFTQSGGNINIDGNNGGVTATSVVANTSILQFKQLNSSINLTGGTLTIVDPHASATVSNAIGYDNATSGTQTSNTAHITRFGNGVSTDAGGTTSGFRIDAWTNNAYLSLGSIEINGGTGTNRTVSSVYQLAAVGNVTVKANSTLNLAQGLLFGGNLTVEATGTYVNTAGGAFASVIASNTASNLTFGPSTIAQTITNSGTIGNLAASPTANFVSLTVNNTNAAGLTLPSSMSVSGTLSINTGIINMGANILTLGVNATTPGTLTYNTTGAGRIIGRFKRWIDATTGVRTFPLGTATTVDTASINFTVAPTAGTLTAQWVAGDAGFSNAAPLVEGAITVDKVHPGGVWQIDAADGLAGGTYTASFNRSNVPNPAVNDFTKLVLLKRSGTSGDWALEGTHVATTGTNTAPVLSRTGLTTFSQFAIGAPAAVLPVEFTHISAKANGTLNLVTFTTASEIDLKSFNIERSATGTEGWSTIGNMKPKGASTYAFIDNQPTPISYYRVRSIDLDGKEKVSKIVSVNSGKGKLAILSLYPNPTKEATTIDFEAASTGLLWITVKDITGKVVLSKNSTTTEGVNQITLDMSDIANGLYLLAISDKTTTVLKRIVKQ